MAIESDERIVAVYIKIRNAIKETTKDYEEALQVLEKQRDQLKAELLRRLHERGATQTKTPNGTAFIAEKMTATIADEGLFGQFVLEQQDTAFYQRRVKIEHLKEYMAENNDALPPGVSIFRELDINVRAPRIKKGTVNGVLTFAGAPEEAGGGQDTDDDS